MRRKEKGTLLMALAAVGVQAGIAFAAQSVELADGWEFRRGILAAEKCRLLAGSGEISNDECTP